MRMPATDDTIVAVSSAWEPAAVSILRLSGPDAVRHALALGAAPPPDKLTSPNATQATLTFADQLHLPADVFWFFAPRSYTGQDVVELHTVGCLPLVRLLAGELIGHGARRALPGEFTARAYLCGKLDAAQVGAVQALVSAESAAGAREAARLARRSHEALVRRLGLTLTGLLARIEAGIDFVDEEDVQFITPAEVRRELGALLRELSEQEAGAVSASRRMRPHVALAGLPNAGKSTLFNTLLGYERAIVAPVLGTTRDVLSAELMLGTLTVVLQDCAGLGRSEDELELAAHHAAERAADEADLVLWVHQADQPWSADEIATCRYLQPSRVVVVLSKSDLLAGAEAGPLPDLPFAGRVEVSAAEGVGLEWLRTAAGAVLGRREGREGAAVLDERLRMVRAAVERAVEVVGEGDSLAAADLLAMELRGAHAALETLDTWNLDERILDRIFADFCIGK